MCRRTSKEVWDNTRDETCGYPDEDSMMGTFDFCGQLVCLCHVCQAIIDGNAEDSINEALKDVCNDVSQSVEETAIRAIKNMLS